VIAKIIFFKSENGLLERFQALVASGAVNLFLSLIVDKGYKIIVKVFFVLGDIKMF
jgi:hypothetical protein